MNLYEICCSARLFWVFVWVTLPALDPLSSDTTSITWWPFVPGRGNFCLCVYVCACVMWMCECVWGRRCGACSRTPTSLPPRAQWSCPGLPTGCCPALMPSSTFCRHTHLLKIGSAALQKIFWSFKSQWAKSSKVCWCSLRKRPLKDSQKVLLNSSDIWKRLLIRVLDLVWSATYFNQRLKGLPFTIFILMLILLNDFIILGFSCLLPQLLCWKSAFFDIQCNAGTSSPVLFHDRGFGNRVSLSIVAQPSAGPGNAQALFSYPTASNTVVQW